MYTREQGIQAIIDLQKTVGVRETKQQAARGWDALSDSERRKTELAHKAVCGGFSDMSTVN